MKCFHPVSEPNTDHCRGVTRVRGESPRRFSTGRRRPVARAGLLPDRVCCARRSAKAAALMHSTLPLLPAPACRSDVRARVLATAASERRPDFGAEELSPHPLGPLRPIPSQSCSAFGSGFARVRAFFLLAGSVAVPPSSDAAAQLLNSMEWHMLKRLHPRSVPVSVAPVSRLSCAFPHVTLLWLQTLILRFNPQHPPSTV